MLFIEQQTLDIIRTLLCQMHNFLLKYTIFLLFRFISLKSSYFPENKDAHLKRHIIVVSCYCVGKR